MVFSSLLFLFRFLPAALLLYFAAPRSWKNAVLFFVSLIFYAWGEPVYLVLMIFSTLVDYTHGRMAAKWKHLGKLGLARGAVASSVVINLLLLGFFKYGDFLIQNVNLLFHTSLEPLNLPLPIGISFYTFQTMSYTIDVYRGQAPVQKNLLSFGAYVAMFPQLIAGPIVRYQEVARELDSRRVTAEDFAQGIRRFTVGLGKKVLLANQVGLLWEEILKLEADQRTLLTSWLGAVAFAFQLYFDFSGYSDMAIGLGRMLGFHFPENFNYPYLARSITDFWRRWHITLGIWFREYVYIPLGGNRKGKGRQVFNILLVWILTGIWHGADYPFLFWGLYFAVLLILEKFLLARYLCRLPGWIQRLYTLILVLLSWVIFSLDSGRAILAYLPAMLGFQGVGTSMDFYLLQNYGILLLILTLGCTPIPAKLAARLCVWMGDRKWILELVFFAAVFSLCMVYLSGDTYNPFLYFRF